MLFVHAHCVEHLRAGESPLSHLLEQVAYLKQVSSLLRAGELPACFLCMLTV
jgi:hypothetical protein